AFEADQDLLTTRVTHQSKQFIVLGDTNVCLGEPANLFAREEAQETLVMLAADEAVIVSEFDEGPRPDTFDRLDFSDDFFNGFELVIRGQQDRAGAELAFVRATAAGLDGDAIVFFRIEQIETWHGRFSQIELAVRSFFIEFLQTIIAEILEHLGPE